LFFCHLASGSLQWTTANVGPFSPFIYPFFPGYALINVVGLGNDVLILNQLPGTNDTVTVQLNTTTTAVVGPMGGIWHGFDCLVANSTISITVLSSAVVLPVAYFTIFPGTSLMLLTINGTAAAPKAYFEHLERNITLQVASNESLWESLPIPYNHNATQQLNYTAPPPMLAHTQLFLIVRLHYFIIGTPWYFYPPIFSNDPTTYYSISYYHDVAMNTSCRDTAAHALLIGEFYPSSLYTCSFVSCGRAFNGTAVAPLDQHVLNCSAPASMQTVGCKVELTGVWENTQISPNKLMQYPVLGWRFEFFFPTSSDCHPSGGGGDTAAIVILSLLFSAAVILLAVLGFFYYRKYGIQSSYESIQH